MCSSVGRSLAGLNLRSASKFGPALRAISTPQTCALAMPTQPTTAGAGDPDSQSWDHGLNEPATGIQTDQRFAPE